MSPELKLLKHKRCYTLNLSACSCSATSANWRCVVVTIRKLKHTLKAIVFYVPQDRYHIRNLGWASGANASLPNIFSTQELFGERGGTVLQIGKSLVRFQMV